MIHEQNIPFPPCGVDGWPPCPPEPAVVTNGVGLYTLQQMKEHGLTCQRHGYNLHAAHKPLPELPRENDL